MAEDRDALIEHYRRSRAEMSEAIAGLSDEHLTEVSLDGWSVKDHLSHLAVWDAIRADEVVRISAGHASAWRITEGAVEAYNEMMYEARRDCSLAQARWEFETSRQRFLDALATATPAGLDASRYGGAALVSGHEAEHAGWIRRWREERGY